MWDSCQLSLLSTYDAEWYLHATSEHHLGFWSL